MRLRPSIEAADLPQIRGARQPLPKTARYRLGCSRCDSLERNTRICVNRTICWAEPAQNVTTLHGPGRRLAKTSRAPGAASSATQAQPLDQRAIPLHVDLREVLDQPLAPPDQQQQPAP